MSSFDEVIGKITEDEVEGIMRGSHDDQIKYMEDKLDIKIRSNYEGWGEFMEIFERRAACKTLIDSERRKNTQASSDVGARQLARF